MVKYKQVAGGTLKGLVFTVPNERTCSICRKKNLASYVDGRTKGGPWAFMCDTCFKINGVGLGIGRGQRYEKV